MINIQIVKKFKIKQIIIKEKQIKFKNILKNKSKKKNLNKLIKN